MALAVVELAALLALCQAQVERAQARQQAERMQDAAFGYCLDQINLSIARCRQRFSEVP